LERTVILYLHGFTSGPQSHKAQALGARMRERGLGDKFLSPQLPAAPADAITLAEDLIRRHGVTTVVGSSLGGYYATYLAEKFDLKGVLVNPAVVAHLSLQKYIGPQTLALHRRELRLHPGSRRAVARDRDSGAGEAGTLLAAGRDR
jgi:predicted esterase YcpF (UPF0227 family)